MTASGHDRDRIREVIGIAHRAYRNGNRPFGALLVSADGTTLSAGENTQLTDKQILAHAEMNLLHKAVKQYGQNVLGGSTLYTSAEPCAMCVGAIFWSGVGRLVFGLSAKRLHEIAGHSPEILATSARDVLDHPGRKVELVGPVLEKEAESLYLDCDFS